MLKTVFFKEGMITFFIGLAVAQVIATAQVFQSNQFLMQKTKALQEAGFVTVPNALVQPMLSSLKPAFYGGLFFTATLGLFIIVLTLLFIAIVLNVGKGKPLWLLLPWLGLLIFVNLDGFNIFASAYGTMVPLVIFLFLWQRANSISTTVSIKVVLWGGVGAVSLVLLFTAAFPDNGFIRFRDRLLLNHRVGQAMNDFYYRNTLFAAEAIKTNSQKQLISYRIVKQSDSNLDIEALEKRLAQYDYLRLDKPKDGAPFDLTLKVLSDQDIMIEDRFGTTLKTTPTADVSTSKTILTQFSKVSDRNHRLRQLTLIGLLCGLPLFIYGVLFCTGYGLLKQWCPPGFAAAGSAAFCLIAGVSFWWLLWLPGPMDEQTDGLVDDLQNGGRIEKLVALETLARQRIEITSISFYQDLLSSSDVAVRYKVAQSLGYYHSRQSREGVERLLQDVSPNVRCMALQSLGRWGQQDDIPLILKTLQESDHWYVQYYAYKALRQIGWLQPAIKVN